ncbi:hypothetical protein WN944_026041 [Citrus x changshan-huyou]|uniref:Mutator-like transposase n=1 Tax=Citrus x changshan-huyou TaxID=2935761 RepID=A0AAP0LTN5_9ROSI
MKDSRQLTFMCDRQKGIQNALRLKYPNAHVRYCARHLLANLKSKHLRTDFKGGFWEAARASNQIDFERAMEKVKSADAGVYETLRRVHPRFWSRHAFDRTSKSDHCINNMTESFNAWLDKVNWPVVLGDEILPHLVKKQPGRPKLNRIREPDEVPPEKMRYKMQCKCCHEFGHNKRACPINPNNANKKTRHFQPHYNFGPSSSKVKRPESHANWIGVQGRRIMQGNSVETRGNGMATGNGQTRPLDKGKAPVFPPWRNIIIPPFMSSICGTLRLLDGEAL